MAAVAVFQGRFVAKRHKVWDGFTGGDGAPVEAGQSLTFWVLTEHDQDLCEVIVAKKDAATFASALDGLTFGAMVEVKGKPLAAKQGAKIESLYQAADVQRVKG